MKTTPSFKTFGTGFQDLFAFADGRPVETRADWAERRKELRAILERECYGASPAPPCQRPRLTLIKPAAPYPGGEEGDCCHMSQYIARPFADSDFGLALDIYAPQTAAKLPAVICGDGCWLRVTPEHAALAASRGYALVVFNRCAAVQDYMNENAFRPAGDPARDAPCDPPPRDTPIHQRNPGKDFGAVSAWAWGFSRAMDALELLPQIDPARVAVCGHSRGGKAALLAGAFDSRFAATIANGSGTGGAGSLLFQDKGAEPLVTIVRAFPTWFNARLAAHAGREDVLPFDSHFLMALCAPRPLLCSDALSDAWANPAGAALALSEARKAYRRLDCPDWFAASHFRNGGHGHLRGDWTAMFDYLDCVLFSKPIPWNPLWSPFGLS
jgi:Dipeptidyl aminopeptidases/acylaminoacyl-peptidases